MSNGKGLAGFILSLIGLFLTWTIILAGISPLFWLLGLIFSIIGMFKRPRGFAIAGLIISLLTTLLLFGFLKLFDLLPTW